MDEVSGGWRNFSLDNFKIQLGFTEGLPAGSMGWILSLYAGHGDFMVILLLDKMRSKEERENGTVQCLGLLWREWNPGSKLYVFGSSLKEKED